MEAPVYYVIGVALAVLAGVWKVFSTQLDAIVRRIETLEEITVSRKEHTEFAKRLDQLADGIAEQVKTIEMTRPTTGELQAVGNANKEQISKLEARVGSLEDNLRRRIPQDSERP